MRPIRATLISGGERPESPPGIEDTLFKILPSALAVHLNDILGPIFKNTAFNQMVVGRMRDHFDGGQASIEYDEEDLEKRLF